MLWFNEKNGEQFVIDRVTTRDVTDFRNHMRNDRARQGTPPRGVGTKRS
jgi:hypothetical protein